MGFMTKTVSVARDHVVSRHNHTKIQRKCYFSSHCVLILCVSFSNTVFPSQQHIMSFTNTIIKHALTDYCKLHTSSATGPMRHKYITIISSVTQRYGFTGKGQKQYTLILKNRLPVPEQVCREAAVVIVYREFISGFSEIEERRWRHVYWRFV